MNKSRKATGRAIAVFAILTIALAGAPAGALAAAGHGGGVHGVPGGHPGFHNPGFVHHGFHHRHFGFGPVYPYPYFGYDPYGDGYSAPPYWYYCPSYGAYYPSVTTCPENWVPVPSS